MTSRRAARAAGFTLIEALVVIAILSILAAVAMPSMSNWLLGRKALGAAVFYQEGFALARNTAIAHNAHSRLVLTENAANGKMDWRVDLCFSDSDTACNADGGGWSTTGAAANGDPNGADTFRSVARSAGAMPGEGDLAEVVGPSGATEVYFTPLGWIDTTVTPSLTRIDLKPSIGRSGAFKPLAVVLTLAGVAAVCDPSVSAPDTHGCPL